MSGTLRRLIGLAMVALLAASCASTTSTNQAANGLGNPGDCLVIDMAVSPEKIDLLTSLAQTFNQSKTKVGDTCIFVNPKSKASGAAMQALANGWNEKSDGPLPVVWSPASSAWGAILDQRRAEAGQPPMANQGTPFMNTPLVIAMPRPMAEALGWPDTPIGWSDILQLARSAQGWAAYGHPEWGPFKLGKTNPNFSTSGLSALIAQNYAATGKTRDLTVEDLATRDVVAFNSSVESSVVHYGDTTLTFLNNWYRADQEGTGLQYVSAAAVEEKSVIDYNAGNPDGVLDPGEELRPPRVPLVAIYPKEGTLYSDNPFFILDAPWVTDAHREGAKAFQDFVQQPENQRRVLEYNFRPGNPEVPIEAPIVASNGVDPNQPQTLLQTPQPAVMVELLRRWGEQRKGARVLLVVDVSGSMKDRATRDTADTKLDLAKAAALGSLEEFKSSDLVGLREFSTGLGDGTAFWNDLVPIGPMSQNERALRQRIEGLFPTNGTPLYDVVLDSFRTMYDQYDPSLINAVVLLTDGKNDDGNVTDDAAQLERTVSELRRLSQGELGRPIRVFTIAYGTDADLSVLKQIAEATNAAAYNASDPKSINKVFTAVVSNF
ncbi:vWA domain-containing protein [Rhabdothermincola sp.]|uniref:vWA domain-containing protein n=1 Tax=Rhabdothermincola sp. TaxID=2820405 RepID=UPI002FE00425